MSEFSDATSINRFLGTSAGYVGYDDNKYVLNIIKDNPTSVIIFDEIDKAHPKIINLLYQMLDDGYIKDSKNNTIKLNNNILILTTKHYRYVISLRNILSCTGIIHIYKCTTASFRQRCKIIGDCWFFLL